MSQDEIPKDFQRETETVSSLLEQNDDLMARIAAFAKKTSDLEKRLNEVSLSKSELSRKIEILSEQILVLREKDKIQKGRLEGLENKIRNLLTERDFQEMRYAELYQKNQDLQKKREATNRILADKIARLSRYKTIMNTEFYPAYRDLKARHPKLLEKAGELSRKIFAISEALNEEQNAHKKTQQELKKHITEHSGEAESFKNMQEKYHRLKDERTVLQNRVISAQRAKEDLQEKNKKEVDEWREKVSQFRQEAKGLKLENQSHKEDALNLQDENKKLLRQNEKLRDQNESIQELWNDNRRKLEKSNQKEVALQKLNQELSLQLKETRKMIEKMRQSLNETQSNAENKIKRLKREIETKEPPSNTASKAMESPAPNVTMERLETLLAEIQSGYSQTLVTAQLPSHTFIEKTQLMSEEGELEA